MDRSAHGSALAQAAALIERGRHAEAEALARRVLARDANDVDALQILGLVASMRHRFDEATAYFKQGLQVSPGAPMLHCGLAKVQSTEGRYDDALASYDAALAIAPGDPYAIAGKAETLEHLGRFDDARELLAPLVAEGREDGEAAFIFATLERRAGRHEAAVALTRKHLAAHDLDPITRRKLLYGLGMTLERLEQYDDAFAAFAEANAIRPARFSIDAVRQRFAHVREIYSAERLPQLAQSTNTSDVPVFVVSMPRSGSTLVEQILSAHPDVFGAGETNAMIERITELPKETRASVPYPDAVTSLDQRVADRLATRYLDQLRGLDPSAAGAARIVDKHPQNFRLLGLIQLLLPRARVIVCRRDPMAVCFSCFQQPLSPVAMPYTTDLRSLGLFHREFERLIEHWIDVLDIPILTVQYETLVAEQERVSRAIIDFCGLEWNDACLRFHRADRSVATASYDQVRRPMYTAAVKRYERYAAHVEPLREALQTE